MAYEIILTDPQYFSYNPISQRPQETWSFNPMTPLRVVGFIGVLDPPDLNLLTKIQNYHLSYPGVFQDIYVRLVVENPLINGSRVPFLSVTGPIPTSQPGYRITENNLEVTNIIDYILYQIPVGTYRSTLNFYVNGKLPGNQFQQIDHIQYNIDLLRLRVGDVEILPAGFVVMSYELGTPLPSSVKKTVYVSGSFTVKAGKHIRLTGGNLVFQYESEGVKTYTGFNQQDVFFHLENSINTEPNLGSSYVTDVEFITQTLSHGVGVRILIFGNEDLTATPDRLDFTAVKGVREAGLQLFNVLGVGNYTIVIPNWLDLIGPHTGSNSTTHQIKPVHSDNLNEGIYEGNIKILFGAEELLIAVRHEVVGSFKTGYFPNQVNFTKDRAAISEIFGLDTQKVELQLSTSAFDYNTTIDQITPSRFTLGIFKNETEFWLGNLVDKIMPRLRKLEDIGLTHLSVPIRSLPNFSFQEYKFYKVSSTYLLLKYLNRETNAQEGLSIIHDRVKFLKGRRPKRLNDRSGILDYIDDPIRVTKNSYTMLALYQSAGSVKTTVYRNGNLLRTFLPDRGEHEVFGMLINFESFIPGDVIDIELNYARLIVIQGETPVPHRQRYILFPEGKYSYHIGWENEHGTLQLFEFTGDYSFKGEYKGITSMTFKTFLESTEKMGNTHIRKFSANTGWILKSNQQRIESLIKADIAWVIFTDPNMKPIELIPADAKLTNIDSEAGEYQYDVEFTINPKHELENHSF